MLTIEEVVGAVRDGRLVPRDRRGLWGRATKGKVVQPAAAVLGELDVKGGVVDVAKLRPVVEAMLVPPASV